MWQIRKLSSCLNTCASVTCHFIGCCAICYWIFSHCVKLKCMWYTVNSSRYFAWFFRIFLNILAFFSLKRSADIISQRYCKCPLILFLVASQLFAAFCSTCFARFQISDSQIVSFWHFFCRQAYWHFCCHQTNMLPKGFMHASFLLSFLLNVILIYWICLVHFLKTFF